MAIFHQGPLTSGIRGKVGDLIFQMVNGIQIVRQMPPSIADPNTPLQQIQRAAFSQAVIEWRDLNVEERALWDFQASLRGNRKTYLAARRVDHSPKPTNTTLFDGHNSVVAQKSREADSKRMHGDVAPDPIDLQVPPPYAKTKNVPPHHVVVLLAVGSLGAPWNLQNPLIDYDGLWWYNQSTTTPTEGSKHRVWVQPPYPIHRQRITIWDPTVPPTWGAYIAEDFDRWAWAWKCQVKALTVPIVAPALPPDPAFVNIPYVWKSQLDFLDKEFLDTKGSAVIRFYLPDDLAEGLWQVWPTLVDLLGVEGAGTFVHPPKPE